MANNTLKSALLKRAVTIGAWVQIGHPACAEIFARAGFDWVCVDLEHGAIDLETMTNIFRTIDGFDCTPVARIPSHDPVWIHRCLDAGARGLFIPMVSSAAQAEAAVREAKYPPEGIRGIGYGRANMHGMDFQEYFSSANDEIAMVMQIEHWKGIENLDEILDTAGVDGLFIGPMDLSGSFGVTAQLDHPKMVHALAQYREKCASRGRAAGTHVVRPTREGIRAAIQAGYTLIALGTDGVFLQDGARAALKEAKKAGAEA